MKITTIACPVCRGPIATDPAALLAGERVICDHCETALFVEPGERVRKTIERFAAAKQEVRQVMGGRGRRRNEGETG